MEHDHDPKNRRERVNRRGWRLKSPKLIALSEPDEWRSISSTSEWRGAF